MTEVITGPPLVSCGHADGLQVLGAFGRDAQFAPAAADAWRLTLDFMALPFTWTGPLVTLKQLVGP